MAKGRKPDDLWRAGVEGVLVGHGYRRSFEAGLPVDRNGEPVPLYTYPAIEYLDQLDFGACDVFEFGSGQSTLWWSRRARSVTAVEHDDRWARRLGDAGRANVRCVFAPRFVMESGERYAGLAGGDRRHHVIVLDGLHQHDCARAARAALAPGGLVILDNSDFYPDTCRLLREQDLLQVDLAGFKPCHAETQVTSLFFDRGFALEPRHGRQPVPPVGGKPHRSPFDRPRRIDFKDGKPVIV